MDVLLQSMLPKEIYQHFELVSMKEELGRVEMVLEELPELLPAELAHASSIVLDGFCNPLELLHFSIKGKPLYLKLYRRRWKSSGSGHHYSNRYNFHPEGVKATHEFASFLKGEIGLTADEYVRFLVGTQS
jgi:hypothetical protein